MVVSLKKKGYTYKKIYEITSLGYDRIKRICRIYNINKSPNNLLDINEDIKNKIQNEFNKIGNVKKVAKIFGITYQKIINFIVLKERKSNIEIKKKNNVHYVNEHRKK